MTQTFSPDDVRSLTEKFSTSYKPGKVRAILQAGSGLDLEVPGWEESEVVPFDELFPFPIPSLIGHTKTLSIWRRGDESLLVMNGRFHLYQGYSAQEVTAPIRMAALLGAEVLLATNAAGSLDPDVPPGSLVVVDDHINMLGTNPLLGPWAAAFGDQFIDLSRAYDAELRTLAEREAKAAGFHTARGVYTALMGPTYETPAEVRMVRNLGGTLVGMSTVPEVIVANHHGMRVLVMSLVTNLAAGVVEQTLDHQEVVDEGRRAAAKLKILVGRLINEVFPG